MAFLLTFLGILGVILTFSYFSYRTVFFASRKNRGPAPKFESQRFEDYRPELLQLSEALEQRSFEAVTIFSQDGLRLYGRYYENQKGPIAICFHGYRSNPMADFAASSQLFTRLGCSLLIVDQRAHWHSEGISITFGIRERLDVQSWAEYAADRWPQRKIILYGVSMGGAAVLMASDLPLPENVMGIIADCPYSSPKEIICRVGEHQKRHTKLMWPFIRLGAKVYGGFFIRETTAAKAVSASPLPILIFHGEADLFVPPEMSEEAAKANPEKVKRFTFPGAKHTLSIMADPEKYENCVRVFLNSL